MSRGHPSVATSRSGMRRWCRPQPRGVDSLNDEIISQRSKVRSALTSTGMPRRGKPQLHTAPRSSEPYFFALFPPTERTDINSPSTIRASLISVPPSRDFIKTWNTPYCYYEQLADYYRQS
ncbi:hypothetical protein Zmor_002280 [Zophobas morio]|uniref:Uncharacterized protein n=1 Tax=Zophobas morio TaxID=2755281 RepID=A0AA38J454_9CUCU|nr:hypothetical protein Zmor_002280 [Zophobas morio]